MEAGEGDENKAAADTESASVAVAVATASDDEIEETDELELSSKQLAEARSIESGVQPSELDQDVSKPLCQTSRVRLYLWESQ